MSTGRSFSYVRSLPAAAIVALALLLTACGNDTSSGPPPPPQTVIPQDATGHYCGMFLFEHTGPKGQILVRDREGPVWFTTIREVFAYTHLPEEPRAIVATYVQDMARVNPDQSFPFDAWIDAHQAWYLIQSSYIGGMGVPDALPFSSQDAAKVYQEKYGGRIVAFQDVPQDYIFGPAELPDPSQLSEAAASAAGASQ